MKIAKNKSFDLLGISSAGICLIHCLIFPLLAVIPLGVSHNHFIDLTFALIGLYVILRIKNLNQNKPVKYILWTSISLILVSVLLDMIFHFHYPLIYLGAIGLIIGHLKNYFKYKKL